MDKVTVSLAPKSDHEFMFYGRNISVYVRTIENKDILSKSAYLFEFVEISYFDVLNTNTTIKIGENDIFKIKRTKNPHKLK